MRRGLDLFGHVSLVDREDEDEQHDMSGVEKMLPDLDCVQMSRVTKGRTAHKRP